MKASSRHDCSHGYGMSSVRFICGTQDIHKELEKISEFWNRRYHFIRSSFDANGGVFEPLFTEEDALFQTNCTIFYY